MKNQNRPRTIHRTKLFGGLAETPQRLHQRHTVAMACRCGKPGTTLFQVFLPREDFMSRFYGEVREIVDGFQQVGPFALPPTMPYPLRHLAATGKLPEVPMTFGPFVAMQKFAACGSCRKDAEREVARLSDKHLVWIDHPPDALPIIVQVPGRAA